MFLNSISFPTYLFSKYKIQNNRGVFLKFKPSFNLERINSMFPMILSKYYQRVDIINNTIYHSIKRNIEFIIHGCFTGQRTDGTRVPVRSKCGPYTGSAIPDSIPAFPDDNAGVSVSISVPSETPAPRTTPVVAVKPPRPSRPPLPPPRPPGMYYVT